MQASDSQLSEMWFAFGCVEVACRLTGVRQASKLINLTLVDAYSIPEDSNARKLLDSPERFSGSGDLNVAAGENTLIRLQHQPIHLGGRSGLPKVGENSGDPEWAHHCGHRQCH